MDYQQAAARLTGRCKESRKLQRNTYLKRTDTDEICVLYHRTYVLAFYADGRIRINTGGWHTISTVDRINSYLPSPWRVGRHRGLTILYRMGSWTPVCTVDNVAEVSETGEIIRGGSAEEYLQSVREADNERNRLRNRGRYWINKARNGEPAKGLTVQNIMAEENHTVRVAKMKLFGMERFFLEAKPKLINEQAGYQLLELENVKALKMTCPSTGAVYLNMVPPHVWKASDAVDWMFNTTDYIGQVTQQS